MTIRRGIRYTIPSYGPPHPLSKFLPSEAIFAGWLVGSCLLNRAWVEHVAWSLVWALAVGRRRHEQIAGISSRTLSLFGRCQSFVWSFEDTADRIVPLRQEADPDQRVKAM